MSCTKSFDTFQYIVTKKHNNHNMKQLYGSVLIFHMFLCFLQNELVKWEGEIIETDGEKSIENIVIKPRYTYFWRISTLFL